MFVILCFIFASEYPNIYYHKGPRNGVGKRTIYYPTNDKNGTPVTADFENDYYDWDSMIDTYTFGAYTTAQGNAVALLMSDEVL